MAREAAAGAVEMAQGSMKKKAGAGAARSWILLDANGEGTIMDVDKYAIMHRVEIHARDLRILDPLLSYPSTILGRERAIVLNLEVLLIFNPVISWCSYWIVFNGAYFWDSICC